MDSGVKIGKKKISITITNDVYEAFKDYCGEKGMKMSPKVEQLMKESVKNQSLRKFME